MGLKGQQADIVKKLDGSVNVVAGAGTGKTYTLTQRIVAVIGRCIERSPEDPDPSSHVLAITFTRKAAAELRSRVRVALMERAKEDPANADAWNKCAVNIDNSWISTIHGMAGRILKENAIEFGIDPTFSILSKQAENSLLAMAMEDVVKEVDAGEDGLLKEFIGSMKIADDGSEGNSISKLVEEVFKRTGYMPDGLDGVRFQTVKSDPVKLLEDLCMKSTAALDGLRGDSKWTPNQAAEAAEKADGIEKALVVARKWLDAFDPDDAFDLESYEEAVLSFPRMKPTFGKGKPCQDEMYAYKLAHKLAADHFADVVNARNSEQLLKFCVLLKDRMDQIKSAGSTKLTETDTLYMCNRLLGMKENADILQRYRDQFDCIMVDEFQDTDKLQMAIINKISPVLTDGVPPLSNVCTVGDMQQSIYRFRGGDVEETQKRIEAMKRREGTSFKLSVNFRSHESILEAVRDVFSQEEVFGSDFLDLEAGCETLDEKCEKVFDGKPRVFYEFVHGQVANKDKGRESVSTEDALKVAAMQIARHFKELHDKGIPLSKMAVLLGRMKYAQHFMDALSAVGIESAITGGSVFAESEIASVTGLLLRFAVNVKDEDALLQILMSSLFQVSDDVLLALVRRPDPESGDVKHVRLSTAFDEKGPIDALGDEDNRSLEFARDALFTFVKDCRKNSPVEALRMLFVTSGKLPSIACNVNANTLFDAGNIKKVLEVVASFEREGLGLAEVAKRYAYHMESADEAPGKVVAEGSDFVQIMTVHSSKGLEFDHVAVAELRDGSVNSKMPLVAENIDNHTYISFKATKSDFSSEETKKIFDDTCNYNFDIMGLDEFGNIPAPEEDAPSSKYEEHVARKQRIHSASNPAVLLGELKQYEAKQERDEARRLAYVAMTRARESLYLSHVSLYQNYSGTFADISAALEARFGRVGEGFEENCTLIDMPVGFRKLSLKSQADVAEALAESGALSARDAVSASDAVDDLVADAALAVSDMVDDAVDGIADSPSSSKADSPSGDDTDSPSGDDEGMISIPVYPKPKMPDVVGCRLSREGIYSYTSLAAGIPEEKKLAGDDVYGNEGLGRADESYVDDGFAILQRSLDEGLSSHGSATDLGIAFHRLCQKAILSMNEKGVHYLEMPSDSDIEAMADSCGLGAERRMWLRDALKAWFGSELCKSFASRKTVLAEVPFVVSVLVGPGIDEQGPDERIVVEGEVDGLAFDDASGEAFLVDYKTGDSEGSSLDVLREKHAFQAKCYAYALLMNGFKSVDANFVRVEERSSKDPTQPLVISYAFDSDDIPMLQDEIARAYELAK